MTRRRLPRGGRMRIPRGGGGAGGIRRISGSSAVLFVIVAVLLWVFAGINPLQLIDMVTGGSGGRVVTEGRAPPSPQQRAANDERAAFLSVVLAETETTWSRIFAEAEAGYEPPSLVLYNDVAQSACGFSSAAVGPFYCPGDQKVYVDLSFFDLLEQRLGAPGDFAQAYVLAHEVGHHVQYLTGTLERYHRDRQRLDERAANRESVKVELQADCYAGIWAHAADDVGILEEGDIAEAIGAASAVGDDMIQRRTQGYVVPESFNHGTAEQRVRWFTVGYRSGDPAACDTFAADAL